MLVNGNIMIGLSGKREAEYVRLSMADRHGLITGATGSGKTVCLQVLAEGFSDAGVPVLMTDVKGDLDGVHVPGEHTPFIDKRLSKWFTDYSDYPFSAFPTAFWDFFGKEGMEISISVKEMGSYLISKILDLNDTESQVLEVLFQYCDQYGYPLGTLDDLMKKLNFMREHCKEVSLRYGHISAATVGDIIVKAGNFYGETGRYIFGGNTINILEWMLLDGDGRGCLNVLDAETLIHYPRLYASILYWILSSLEQQLPERSKKEKPLFVVFIDEAQLLFRNCTPRMQQKLGFILRSLSDRGVAVFFQTWSPTEIPSNILKLLENRIQFSMNAFTFMDEGGMDVFFADFPTDGSISVEEETKTLRKGEAIVSLLDEQGRRGFARKVMILPPQSHIGKVGERVF